MLYRVVDLSYSKLKSGIDDEPLQRDDGIGCVPYMACL